MNIDKFAEKYESLSEAFTFFVDKNEYMKDYAELLTEAKNQKDAASYLTQIYGHMLKYVYQTDRQYRNWVTSICDKCNEIDSLNLSTNELKALKNEHVLNAIIKDGYHIASRDIKDNNSNLPRNYKLIDNNKLGNPNISDLMDKKFLEKFLLDNQVPNSRFGKDDLETLINNKFHKENK